MANWCDCTVAFKGDKDNLSTLLNRALEIPGIDFDSRGISPALWLIYLGYAVTYPSNERNSINYEFVWKYWDKEKDMIVTTDKRPAGMLSCKYTWGGKVSFDMPKCKSGTISDIKSLYEKEPYILVNFTFPYTVYTDLIKAIAEAPCFKEKLDFVYIAEEPNMEIYVNTDIEHKIFKARYSLDFTYINAGDECPTAEYKTFSDEENALKWVRGKIRKCDYSDFPHGNPLSMTLEQLSLASVTSSDTPIFIEVHEYENE